MEPGKRKGISIPLGVTPAVHKPAAGAQDLQPAERLHLSSLANRKSLVVASALVALLPLGIYLGHRKANGENRVPQIVDHLDLNQINALPELLQENARALLAGKFQPPAWLLSMERPSGAKLDYPAQEAIEEVQPTLRWESRGNSYNVAVIDPEHHVVARGEVFKENHWTVPIELARGSVYTWEVSAIGLVRRNSFRVIDDAEAIWLADLRATHGQSHFLLGAASLEMGLLSQAQSEFQALVREHPHSPEAQQLLRTANDLLPH